MSFTKKISLITVFCAVFFLSSIWLAPAPGYGFDARGYANKVVELTNAERRKEGLGALRIDEDLMKATAKRARELESEFGHTRPDGDDWDTVLDEFGVSPYNRWGENVLYNSSGKPGDAVEQWMNSPGHRANILNGGYTHIGVGAYQSGGLTYVVQIFVGR